ncbi:oxidoreductase FAD/NAD(P)-binding protein [Viridothelium virens]|uniref:Oxidoreductase FAD/NAD(P)-binding protein n=1 Tax=Viridothelium virens TaxID=1048519 RepID=A0A6A6HNE8_VIRVR|nr:oxidoreductase FAD/NAD(P)-binding protein [Viridothelium virens]
MAFALALPWHEGEHRAHELLHVYDMDNPTLSSLAPRAGYRLQNDPLLAIGTVDAQSRPWTSVWGGKAGFARPIAQDIIGVKTVVDGKFDPVVEALVGGPGRIGGQIVREEGKGRMVSGLSMHLDQRHRWKLYGRMVAGALRKGLNAEENPEEVEAAGEEGGVGEVQLVVHVEQSLGNCPKYLNRKSITASTPSPKLVSSGSMLTHEARNLISKADLFFLSSSNADEDMDTNHRGGPPGFVRILDDKSSGTVLVWPEYSGNRLYQSLGNLLTTPKAGITFPDFETGDALYVTGDTEILTGKDASSLMPRSNLLVKLVITDSRLVKESLPFRGEPIERSPYNPNVRPLVTESNTAASLQNESASTATLISQTSLTPTISQFRFSMTNPAAYTSGQWVAMDFSEELGMGYSHMRDDDPRSLNDDFVRTFTVSSPPPPPQGEKHDEFDITIRRVGPVTDFLFGQERPGLEVPLKGFGGDFSIQPPQEADEVIPFVAGGVGITPLLAQMEETDIQRIRLFWTLQNTDANIVVDTLEKHSHIAPRTTVFLTGQSATGQEDEVQKIGKLGAKCLARRMRKEDLDVKEPNPVWYLCTGPGLRNRLLEWLQGKKVVHEDFNF